MNKPIGNAQDIPAHNLRARRDPVLENLVRSTAPNVRTVADIFVPPTIKGIVSQASHKTVGVEVCVWMYLIAMGTTAAGCIPYVISY